MNSNQKIIASNWKLNKGPKATAHFFKSFQSEVQKKSDSFLLENKFLFFVSASNWQACSEQIQDIKNSVSSLKLNWGAQNCYQAHQGAFTGENSAVVLQELNGTEVLVGHSERRSLFAEADEILNKKNIAFSNLGLNVMFCIGESLSERESGQTFSVLSRQLELGLKTVEKKEKISIAYEPVWAIGTGKVATSAQIAEAHLHVKSELIRLGFSEKTSILYGGSVKPENSKEIGSIENVSGFLIGGASLEVDSLLKICG
jgi:triosephosphate isomerase